MRFFKIPSAGSRPTDTHPSGRKRRLVIRLLGVAVPVVIASVVLVTLVIPPLSVQARPGIVRVKSYYLALGDSLAYGFQPNQDYDHGYAQQWFALLQSKGSRSFTDYGCPGQSSTAMYTEHGCPFPSHDAYPDNMTQLQAAVAFITTHAHQVSPVSLDIGANDLIPHIQFVPDSTSPTGVSCVDPMLATDEETLNNNLKYTILPDLVEALKNRGGQLTGDLVVMNYYFPFQNICPKQISLFEDFNSQIAADVQFVASAERVSIPLADVFTAFGGSAYPNPNICTYTWMCSGYQDIHATGGQPGEPGNGYGVIAQTFNSLVGND
jgi:lysophospholipase L1-like esterase